MNPLIDNYLQGTLTEKEAKALAQWLKDERNQRAAKAYLRDQGDIHVLLQELDIDGAYAQVREQTQEPTRKQTRTLARPWVRYAAAASLALMMGLGYYWMQRDSTTEQTTQPTITDHQIEAGSDKATLTLDNGEQIALEKGKAYETDNASSNGESITYKEKTTNDIAYNQLTIPRGGQYQIKLSDGTRVWLNSETQLRYPVAFVPGQDREVELVYGEAYFDVSPSTEHNGAKFKVIQDQQNIEVLGTEFNVKAYQDEQNIYTTLVEGKIALEAQNTTNERTILAPGQQADLGLEDRTLTLATVNVYDQVAWRDGVFNFDKMPLKDVMKVLSRWYDMDVEFANTELETVELTGSFNKKYEIGELLALIEDIGLINGFQINNKTVTLE